MVARRVNKTAYIVIAISHRARISDKWGFSGEHTVFFEFEDFLVSQRVQSSKP